MMENRTEELELPQAATNNPKPPGRRSGKGARQKKTDKFRESVGRKQLNERRAQVEKRLGVFDESCAELERSLMELSITVKPVAIPMPVATRGIGFAAVVEYSRMCTTWNFDAVNEICTIYQYYRVGLYCAFYKLYLARYDQGESSSFDVVDPFVLNEEVRQILAVITQMPISTYNILSCIGKVEGTCVWHSVPVQDLANSGERAALYLYPFNIRGILTSLADPAFDQDMRNEFYELNPLPGAQWINQPDVGWILMNANTIWPANYGPEELQNDVHSYSNVLTRVAGRLPKSFISNFTWNPKASKAGLVSFDPAPMRNSATFHREPQPRRAVRRRNACGEMVQVAVNQADAHLYISDQLRGRAVTLLTWSPEDNITGMEMVVGTASFVGETSGQSTRLQIQGRKQAHISPGTVLYRLVDAPRPSNG